MKSLTLDLAARFSAGCVMDSDQKVLYEFDSWGMSPFEFLNKVVEVAIKYDVDIIVIEDVPYGLAKQFMIKPVLRLQGAFILVLWQNGLIEKTLWLNPSTWQRTFEGVFKGKAAGALAAAAELGYTPPNLLELYAADIPEKGKERAKVRAQLKKASTDYVDSFLMGKFTSGFSSIEEMAAHTGVQESFI